MKKITSNIRLSNNIPIDINQTQKNLEISSSLNSNLNYLKGTYKSLISSDINIKEFEIPIKNTSVSAALFFIDGITNQTHINDFILKPLLLKNSIQMNTHEKNNNKSNENINKRKTLSKDNITVTVKKFDLEDFIFKKLIPEANIKKENKFDEIIKYINLGFTALFINNISIAFLIETKSTNQRSISPPLTEPIIKGSHQSFIENIRTNTALLRKIINNENFIIENITVGNITKTDVSICYMSNITNNNLISEVKNRLNNLNIDYLLKISLYQENAFYQP